MRVPYWRPGGATWHPPWHLASHAAFICQKWSYQLHKKKRSFKLKHTENSTAKKWIWHSKREDVSKNWDLTRKQGDINHNICECFSNSLCGKLELTSRKGPCDVPETLCETSCKRNLYMYYLEKTNWHVLVLALFLAEFTIPSCHGCPNLVVAVGRSLDLYWRKVIFFRTNLVHDCKSWLLGWVIVARGNKTPLLKASYTGP